MSTALDFWNSLADHLEAGRKVFLALVAENTAHSPGTVGAKLMLNESGDRIGTVGGGIMELKLLERAAEILAGDIFEPEIQTLHHSRSAEGERSGMICAGSQTNIYLVCRPDSELAAVRRLIRILEKGSSGSLLIDPRGLRVVEQDPDLTRPAIRLEQDASGWRYEEQLLNRRRLAILGGGHCALALAHTMDRLGYDVFVFETREGVFEDAIRMVARSIEIVEDFQQAGERIAFPELTWVVVMTTDFPSDVRALTGVVSGPFRFIGVMGASAKITEIMKRLEAEGASPLRARRVSTPPSGCRSPATPRRRSRSASRHRFWTFGGVASRHSARYRASAGSGADRS